MNLTSGTTYDLLVDNLWVKKKLTAADATITNLTATNATITNLTATTATITTLIVTTFNNPLLTQKGDLLTSNGTINTVLHVGTNGQVLMADSTQSSGLAWTNPASLPGLLPTTTKGDLIVYNGTTNVRQPVGTNGQYLVSESSVSNGIEWRFPVSQGKGYLLTNNGTFGVELPVGTNNQVLIANSAQSAGLQWITPSFPLTNSDVVYSYRAKTSDQVIPDATYTIITFDSITQNGITGGANGPTLPTSGQYFFHASICLQIDAGTVTTRLALEALGLDLLTLKMWTNYSESGTLQTIDVSAIIVMTGALIQDRPNLLLRMRQDSGVPKTILATDNFGGVSGNATFCEYYLLNRVS